MENFIAWGIPALLAIAVCLLLTWQHRRIKRENAEALAAMSRKLNEAFEAGARSRNVVPIGRKSRVVDWDKF